MASTNHKRPRTLHSFFSPPSTKKAKVAADDQTDQTCASGDNLPQTAASNHATYPFRVPHLPQELQEILYFSPEAEGRTINDQPDLDLVYYEPYVPKSCERKLFEFLRHELFFYRVSYNIKRGPVETVINTPRFTTVFGVDETSRFTSEGDLVDAVSGKPVPNNMYRCRPRPIPQCLGSLKHLAENATGCEWNFVLVNYYASGNDSITYHSDDEKFLGVDPAIASFSLGAKRDFLMKHKPTPDAHPSETKPMKLPLASGDMILMRGRTQSKWLHSIPKRKGGEADRGRINITLRRAMVKGGTDNYYNYNVGSGGAYKWDEGRREMMPWTDR
ncbi:hypothetical protein K431DRAFT_289470 [Polychaeton citri CBS 116435]|uniref:Fe2OG dioxygenase domain-containing protein n=1 Tax=Polychaeton citri CBS 116435 TaxID=1314669 RepID=A0A9P4Q0S0_9PEZI|nr:hypothetical protein K431DRAFT_289470 [Polychaeton citri CBS 116435]